MSKFIEKLDRAHQDSPRRLGFGPSTHAQKTPLPFLIGVSDTGQGLPTEETWKHLDALLFKVADLSDVATLDGSQITPPWGVWVDTPSVDLVPRLKDLGCDILMFSPRAAPIEILQSPDLARFVLLPLDWDERMLPALHDLPIDGVAVALDEGTPLTVQQLMSIGSLRRISGKHLLLFLSSSPDLAQLEVLRDSGVACILLDIATVSTQEIAAIRGHIEALPDRRANRDRPGALIPQIFSTVETPSEEEEEDF